MTLWRFFLLVIGSTAASLGGGGTMLAGLERGLVTTGVVSAEEFAVGVALGQSTPGPLAASVAAIGRAAMGLPGALAAVMGLVTVSLAAVTGMRLIPPAWFAHVRVRGALAGVPAYTAALALFLAYRMTAGAGFAPVGLLVGLVVVAGRWAKIPPVWLMLAAVAAGLLIDTNGESAYHIQGIRRP